MAEKKRRLVSFKKKHPFCCLCGGEIPTQTIEHAPPKIMFWDKQRWPGLEVPACQRCNHGSSQSDQLAAFYAIAQSPDFYGTDTNEDRIKFFDKLGRGCQNNISEFGSFFVDAGKMSVLVNGRLETQHKIKLTVIPLTYGATISIYGV